MEFEEQKLIEIAKPYFDSARAGDWKHALRVVKWVKELGMGRQNLYLLITAAYIHDIGWSGVAPQGKLDFDEMLKLEPKANENSEKLISEVLNGLNYSEADIQTVKRLVKAADEHEAEKEDEEIVVDADNLSKLCIEHLQEKYQPDSFLKLTNKFKTDLPARIKTQKGKKLFPQLLADLEKTILKKNKFWAGVILYNLKTNQVLLQKRDSKAPMNPNKWSFFGGDGQPGESLEDCLVRELKEEIGITISPDKLMPLRDYLNKPNMTWRYTYSMEFDTPKSKMTLGEGEDFDWMPFDKALELDLTTNTRSDLEFFLKNKPAS